MEGQAKSNMHYAFDFFTVISSQDSWINQTLEDLELSQFRQNLTLNYSYQLFMVMVISTS